MGMDTHQALQAHWVEGDKGKNTTRTGMISRQKAVKPGVTMKGREQTWVPSIQIATLHSMNMFKNKGATTLNKKLKETN